jgi:hypothetical protein
LPERVLSHYPFEQITVEHGVQPVSERSIFTLPEPGCVDADKLADEWEYRHVGQATLAIGYKRMATQPLIEFLQKERCVRSMLELAEAGVAIGVLVTIQQRFEVLVTAPNQLA